MTAVSRQIAEKEIVIDKMHMKGHIDDWCKEHCDPKKISDLDKVTINGNNIISITL